MAMPSLEFVGMLTRYGAESASNRKQLQDWKSATIADLAENKGAQISSGGGNGINFAIAMGASQILPHEWIMVIDKALQYLDAGLTPSSRTYGRIV